MIIEKEEKIFKDLIQSTGYESAPPSMVNSVISQLRKEQKESAAINATLLPRWIWLIMIFVLSFLFIFTFYNNPQAELFYLSDIFEKLGFLSFDKMYLPQINIGPFYNIILVCVLPAILLQFYFIKHYYERST